MCSSKDRPIPPAGVGFPGDMVLIGVKFVTRTSSILFNSPQFTLKRKLKPADKAACSQCV